MSAAQTRFGLQQTRPRCPWKHGTAVGLLGETGKGPVKPTLVLSPRWLACRDCSHRTRVTQPSDTLGLVRYIQNWMGWQYPPFCSSRRQAQHRSRSQQQRRCLHPPALTARRYGLHPQNLPISITSQRCQALSFDTALMFHLAVWRCPPTKACARWNLHLQLRNLAQSPQVRRHTILGGGRRCSAGDHRSSCREL